MVPPATIAAYVPAGISSFMVLQGVLLPAGLKAATVPSPPPPPKATRSPKPSTGGGGGVGGGSATTYYYVGCYADGLVSGGVPVLPTLLSTSAGMNTSVCAVLASAKGFSYFGMQGGNACYGGSNLAQAKVGRRGGRCGCMLSIMPA